MSDYPAIPVCITDIKMIVMEKSEVQVREGEMYIILCYR